ncbi:hypothetical protein [Desulfovibrio inopinatus]|uniref:hypothetical protein n=1 Tax=Desulfovibrio inopinatus TaxID=102109 RepID=UPI0004209CAF|nr:hypothetical protein [Desulfovibrio inopinatus]
MKSHHRGVVWSIVVVCLIFGIVGCKRRQQNSPTENESAVSQFTFGVAPFTVATSNEDLLAGTMPSQIFPVDPKLLPQLDDAMQTRMAATKKHTISELTMVKCLAATPAPTTRLKQALRDYYAHVGQCASVDYVIVPQILSARERVGSPIGASVPAYIALNMYVVDVNTGDLVKYVHFEEEQQALADDILKAGAFFERGGKWLTASELASFGIQKGLKELGL